MKVCRECNIEKPLSEFYKHSRMADGHLNKCTTCVIERVGKHREANLEKILAYDKFRSSKPHRVQARKDYAQTEEGKKAKRKGSKTYHDRYPLRKAAHIVVGNAVRDKRLKKESECSVCSSTVKIEGHHDDYTKPLDVRWLCEKCHKQWHRENKPIYE
jgi:ribosomal protein S27AE